MLLPATCKRGLLPAVPSLQLEKLLGGTADPQRWLGDPVVIGTQGRKALWDCLSVTEKNVGRLTGENQKTLRNISELLASSPS